MKFSLNTNRFKLGMSIVILMVIASTVVSILWGLNIVLRFRPLSIYR